MIPARIRGQLSATVFLGDCTCVSEEQDKKHGKYVRAINISRKKKTNETELGFCTLCGREDVFNVRAWDEDNGK